MWTLLLVFCCFLVSANAFSASDLTNTSVRRGLPQDSTEDWFKLFDNIVKCERKGYSSMTWHGCRDAGLVLNVLPMSVPKNLVDGHCYVDKKRRLHYKNKPKKAKGKRSICAVTTPIVASRIIGGKDAVDGQFPWQVSFKRPSGSHFCGGVVIAPEWVLTAAHCANNPGATAQVGSSHLHKQTQKRMGLEWFIHPQYDARAITYDYALVKLADPFVYDLYVRPLPLAETQYTGEHEAVQVSGYGYTRGGYNPSGIASTLQYTSLETVSDSSCRSTYGGMIKSGSMICAKDSIGSSTSCSGDSGGPLTALRNGQTTLIGLVSWGNGRCGYWVPSVYADVGYVRDWIRSVSGV